MWVKIEQIIMLTCVNYCSEVPNMKTCFELLGFDVIIDQFGKPWLLEVNMSPALSIDCKIDEMVKP
jgi:tubulin polyglutamylase TTLL2